jgi:hypothetical protein
MDVLARMPNLPRKGCGLKHRREAESQGHCRSNDGAGQGCPILPVLNEYI